MRQLKSWIDAHRECPRCFSRQQSIAVKHRYGPHTGELKCMVCDYHMKWLGKDFWEGWDEKRECTSAEK